MCAKACIITFTKSVLFVVLVVKRQYIITTTSRNEFTANYNLICLIVTCQGYWDPQILGDSLHHTGHEQA